MQVVRRGCERVQTEAHSARGAGRVLAAQVDSMRTDTQTGRQMQLDTAVRLWDVTDSVTWQSFLPPLA